jgi:BirA family biotin operon repressor/biotin-[acetyl-CoA-carboxylase] ligase
VIRAALDVERLRGLLGTRWARVDVVEQTASTNADLMADHAAPDRCALAAEHQTSGRGRLDRTWTSPPRAGLTFSVLLRPSVPLVTWGWLPLLAGVALTEAVRETTGLQTRLKWPNDLLAGPTGAKAAGILVQSSGATVVIGIGCNVSTTADELPTDSATSLQLAGADEVDRTALLAAVLTRIDTREAQWSDCAGDAEVCGLAEAYRAVCATLGTQVRVAVADGSTVEGTATEIDAVGRLVIATSSGEQTIGAGDVTHLRPA